MSDSLSPIAEAPGPRRAACDHCRQKKLKCTGELNAPCSRCAQRGEPCSYSTQKPRGRPRKTALSIPRFVDPAMNISELSDVSEPSPHGVGVYAQHWEFENASLNGAEHHELADFIGNLSELPQDYGMLEPPQVPMTISSNIPEASQSCDCILALSRMLEQIRQDKDLEFLSNLRPLRSAVQGAIIAINCKVCPLQFMSAMQNGLLLCTAIISIAQGYVRVVKAIEAEEIRSSQANQRKILDVGDFSSQGLETFTLEVSPGEWKKLALKIVRAEVFGVPGAFGPSFSSVITRLEERQISWHAHPPGVGFPDAYQATDGKPACLRLVEDSRKIISCLRPYSDDSSLPSLEV